MTDMLPFQKLTIFNSLGPLKQGKKGAFSMTEGSWCAMYCIQWPSWFSALPSVAAMSAWAMGDPG